MSKRNADLENLGKLFPILEAVCANAIKIDVEPYRHVNQKGQQVLQVHQLLSAFHDGEKIYPVKITIHEREAHKNQFYMIITVGEISLQRIKEDSTNTGANHPKMNRSLSDGGASLNINIPTFISYFKRDEGIILKNLPDGLLSEYQQEIKKQVISSDYERENEIHFAMSLKRHVNQEKREEAEEKLISAVENMNHISTNSSTQVHAVKESFLGNQVDVIGQELGLEDPDIDDPTHNPPAPKR